MAGSGVIGHLAGAVEIAERPEFVRGVPGIEGEAVDRPAVRPGGGAGEGALADGQARDRHRRRHALLPFDRGVLDRSLLAVDEALDAELEGNVAADESVMT